jgi:hypothetical protein
LKANLEKESKFCEMTMEVNVLPSNSKISCGTWNPTSNNYTLYATTKWHFLAFE